MFKTGPNILSLATAYTTRLAPIKLLIDADQVARMIPKKNSFQKDSTKLYEDDYVIQFDRLLVGMNEIITYETFSAEGTTGT